MSEVWIFSASSATSSVISLRLSSKQKLKRRGRRGFTQRNAESTENTPLPGVC